MEEEYGGGVWRSCMKNDREKIIVQTSIIGILANLFLAGFKAGVGILSNSISITLDAVNNLTDALSSVITIVGTRLANRAPDREHPLGHGRIEYLTASVISLLVLYAGLTSLIESVKKILRPEDPSYSNISLLIVFVAVLVKFFLGRFVKNRGEKINSQNLIASGEDAGNDTILSLSVFISALFFRITGISLEAYVGVVISLFILKAGWELLQETLSQILGARADSNLTKEIKETINAIPGVFGTYDLFLHNYGPDTYLASAHIEVADTMHAAELDALMRKIERKIYKDFHVIMAGISIYSRNTENKELLKLQQEIHDLVLSREHVLQMHGFYVEEEKKQIHMDIVVDFEEKDRDGLIAGIQKELEEKFPGYQFLITRDLDISD